MACTFPASATNAKASRILPHPKMGETVDENLDLESVNRMRVEGRALVLHICICASEQGTSFKALKLNKKEKKEKKCEKEKEKPLLEVHSRT